MAEGAPVVARREAAARRTVVPGLRAAVELNGPLYAEVLTTAEVIDAIKG